MENLHIFFHLPLHNNNSLITLYGTLNRKWCWLWFNQSVVTSEEYTSKYDRKETFLSLSIFKIITRTQYIWNNYQYIYWKYQYITGGIVPLCILIIPIHIVWIYVPLHIVVLKYVSFWNSFSIYHLMGSSKCISLDHIVWSRDNEL